MRTILLTTALALMTSATVSAQDTKSTTKPAHPDKHACIMADASTLADLGLNEDQLAKVKDIQAACKKDHETAKATGTRYEGATKYETELKAVLTPEQFAKWSQWCDANKAMNKKKEVTN